MPTRQPSLSTAVHFDYQDTWELQPRKLAIANHTVTERKNSHTSKHSILVLQPVEILWNTMNTATPIITKNIILRGIHRFLRWFPNKSMNVLIEFFKLILRVFQSFYTHFAGTQASSIFDEIKMILSTVKPSTLVPLWVEDYMIVLQQEIFFVLMLQSMLIPCHRIGLKVLSYCIQQEY